MLVIRLDHAPRSVNQPLAVRIVANESQNGANVLHGLLGLWVVEVWLFHWKHRIGTEMGLRRGRL